MTQFSESVISLIKRRSSWRTYKSELITENHKKQMLEIIKNSVSSPYEGNCSFHFLKIPELGTGEAKRLGTYGVIRGCQEFIVGTAEKTPYAREHFAYIMEKIILHATELGLGTCWIGGILKRELFADAINLPENYLLPAITPIGYNADKRRIFEKGMRSIIKADKSKRKSWDKIFFTNNFASPITTEEAGIYETPLEMVRLAPSASNRQPWKIVKEKDKDIFHFYFKPHSKIYSSYAKLDIGIAVCHFDLSLKELDIKGEWTISEPDIQKPEFHYYSITWTKL